MCASIINSLYFDFLTHYNQINKLLLVLLNVFAIYRLQLASVILKQYVETHWCAQSEKYRPPETTEWVRITYLGPSI